MNTASKIRHYVTALYGEAAANEVCAKIEAFMDGLPGPGTQERHGFTAADTVLITYGNGIQSPGQAPLHTLGQFAVRNFAALFNTIHLLPFFPSSSDDGFSVVDYARVDPSLGAWEDVAWLGGRFRLIFDLVLNHISARSTWMHRYLEGDEAYADLAIAMDPLADLSAAVRPRASPLLTPFRRGDGRQVHLWTTFSADQVDLNWANPAVMLRMVGVMLDYVRRGAALLRLDAVAYLWKTPGTPCIHLPETHLIVKLLRAILDRAAPEAVLLTETNVPHAENISYFGDGRDEAQMVYNFTLPPLLLHTLAEADATVLSAWASGLTSPGDDSTYLNFTASHDGVGVRPLEGILPEAAIGRLAERVLANQGQLSWREGAGGAKTLYELNATYIDALRQPHSGDPLLVDRFLASQSIQYALPGVPATYLPSLFGARNWLEGLRRTGRARSINRQPFQKASLVAELNDPSSAGHAVFQRYGHLIQVRRRQSAFAPHAASRVLDLGPSVFGLYRQSAHQTLWALTNVTRHSRRVCLPAVRGEVVDLLDGSPWPAQKVVLGPYQYRWLAETDPRG